MVAATLAERIHNGELDAEVLLLEKNKELGNKIRISGG
jgi:predicted flavoprotein YhiN